MFSVSLVRITFIPAISTTSFALLLDDMLSSINIFCPEMSCDLREDRSHFFDIFILRHEFKKMISSYYQLFVKAVHSYQSSLVILKGFKWSVLIVCLASICILPLLLELPTIEKYPRIPAIKTKALKAIISLLNFILFKELI